jgi:Raf kinase inhibitor-like YbhB/YbcL family protein
MALKLKSPAFDNGGRIPDKYARNGRNLSPPLEWSGAPEGTKSFALVIEDPDAPNGMFRHWAVYDIPGDRITLHEGEDVEDYRVGRNDFGDTHYDGPQPPAGDRPHHYHFKLAALGTNHIGGVQGEASAAAVWDKAQPHVLEQTELVGTYQSS